MSENACMKLRKLIAERAPYLEISTINLPKNECVLDYRDPKITPKASSVKPEEVLDKAPLFGLIGSLFIDGEINLQSSDIPVGMLVKGQEPKMPTNVIQFPERCLIEQVHFFDHKYPTVHIHVKCEKLGDKGLRQLADVIMRTTRRTREFAGIK